jgi:hypothetical protein
MSKYRKPFLALLKPIWLARLPEWQHGIWSSPHRAPRDATFTNPSRLATRGIVFHAVINFTPKWPGAFTADILVASSLDPLPEPFPFRWDDHIPELPIGSYRIGAFVTGGDIWWRLVDDAAESYRFYASLPGVDASAASLPRTAEDWYAPSYDVPLPEIMQQAAANFTDTYERYVASRLVCDA